MTAVAGLSNMVGACTTQKLIVRSLQTALRLCSQLRPCSDCMYKADLLVPTRGEQKVEPVTTCTTTRTRQHRNSCKEFPPRPFQVCQGSSQIISRACDWISNLKHFVLCHPKCHPNLILAPCGYLQVPVLRSTPLPTRVPTPSITRRLTHVRTCIASSLVQGSAHDALLVGSQVSRAIVCTPPTHAGKL